MKFIIKNRNEVLEYSPTAPTYVIRIVDCNDVRPILPLTDSPSFRRINLYRFDDCEVDAKGNGPMQPSVAKKLISDFALVKKEFTDLEHILIHCNEGESRSPAVAAALNEIFKLGHVTWRFSVDYPKYNDHVYKQLVRTAGEMDLV